MFVSIFSSSARWLTYQTAYRAIPVVGSVCRYTGSESTAPHTCHLTRALEHMGASSSTAVAAAEAKDLDDEMVLNGTCYC